MADVKLIDLRRGQADGARGPFSREDSFSAVRPLGKFEGKKGGGKEVF